MLAKLLCTKRKSASAPRCLRCLGATIDIVNSITRTANRSGQGGIFASMFTKGQHRGHGDHWAWRLTGNYCHFADVVRAADDPGTLALWREELAGKLVVVADVSTGSSDIGSMPLDAEFPLSGVHTNVMHTILTEQFLRELSLPAMLA